MCGSRLILLPSNAAGTSGPDEFRPRHEHMSRIILIKAAETEWQAQGRLVGDTDLQLNEKGRQQARDDAQAVADFRPDLLCCGADQPTLQTGETIAEAVHLKLKKVDNLREMGLGHWEGLTLSEFRERFGKVYKQWRSDPLSVKPPEGESVEEVAERLEAHLAKLLKKNGDRRVAVVLGAMAFAVARCRFDDGGYGSFWKYAENDQRRHEFDLNLAEEASAPADDNGA